MTIIGLLFVLALVASGVWLLRALRRRASSRLHPATETTYDRFLEP